MNSDTYVYCTECINGKDLIENIIDDTGKIPEKCKHCCPLNPEDSMRFEDRRNYEEG